MLWLAVVLAVLSVSQVGSGLLNTTSIILIPDGSSIYPCLQVNHREPEIESSMMGLWYVFEIIQHRDSPKHHGVQTATCPKLNLYQTQNIIKVIWHENAGDVQYTFKMVDPENSGYWIVWSKQSGSLLQKGYDQFAGSVQVIEANPTRMVLTFCAFSRSHFSLVMVRNITIPHDTQDTRKTLLNYGLPEVSIRQTCVNERSIGSAATTSLSILAVALPSLMLLAVRVY